MAENQEHGKPKEREIPVFTVLKNNCILKNIFLLDNPPSFPVEKNGDKESEMEEILVVGRHPDCNIKLEHPSISRFHLRIHSKPGCRSLFVTDLSSVHGTWVSGKRIEPRVTIKLNEGDTLNLGVSSRFYRLHWIPLSRAYDVDNPFVPQLDAADDVKEEDETEESIDQDENSLSCRNDQVETMSDNIHGLELLFSDENLGSSVARTSPMAPVMPEDLCYSFCNEVEVEKDSSLGIWNQENEPFSPKLFHFEKESSTPRACFLSEVSQSAPQLETMENTEGLALLFSDMNCGSPMAETSPMAPVMPEDLYTSFCNEEEVEKDSSLGIFNQENELVGHKPFHFEKESSTPRACFPSEVSQIASQLESMENSVMNSEKKSGVSIWSRRGKPESVKIDTSRSRGRCGRINMISLFNENDTSELVLEDHYASPDNTEQIFTPDMENTYSEDPDKENTYNEQTFTPDKENKSPDSLLVRSSKNKDEEASKSEFISKIPISSVDQDEKEIFTLDKENMTPNSHVLRSMNIGKYRLSPLKKANNSNVCQEQTVLRILDNPEVLQERKSKFSASKSRRSLKKETAVLNAREDRDPFRTLPLNSTSNNKATSKPSVPADTMVHHSLNNTMKVERKRWIIVVDTGCLLNKKTRKELQLLRGLRGTSLIIPRIVVRELDCMKKRGNFFTRTTEVSAALEWIQESMAVAKWWIHVQTSAEEGQLIPPTPPASSHWFSDEKGPFSVGSKPFSPYNLQEIVTPTAADHILECALLFKRTRYDGQLVLLSDDVTLKIKAMAEGVICETAEEFRRSLVNPFSTRFLYSNSSPIGPTWSCVDDAVLKEKYYPSPSKKLSKSGEGVKGLKLILLHNSNFRQITPV